MHLKSKGISWLFINFFIWSSAAIKYRLSISCQASISCRSSREFHQSPQPWPNCECTLRQTMKLLQTKANSRLLNSISPAKFIRLNKSKAASILKARSTRYSLALQLEAHSLNEKWCCMLCSAAYWLQTRLTYRLATKEKQLNKLANCQLQPAASIAAFVDLFRDWTDRVRPIDFRRLIENSAKM